MNLRTKNYPYDGNKLPTLSFPDLNYPVMDGCSRRGWMHQMDRLRPPQRCDQSCRIYNDLTDTTKEVECRLVTARIAGDMSHSPMVGE
eukprot:6478404-Amphidinium_carterae.2